MRTPFLATLCLLTPWCPTAWAEDPPPTWTIDLGAAYERLPSFPGSAKAHSITEPAVAVSFRDWVDFSVLDGLTVDLIHDQHWHGGVYANYLRGRSSSDLGTLAGAIDTVPATFVGGPYLSYAFTEHLEGGVRWMQDLTRRGAQGEFYLSWDLPDVGHFSQSLEATGRVANRAMQQRYFGVDATDAMALGTSPYRANGGLQEYSLGYTGVMPLTQHIALAANFELARLTGSAADSPLVRFGGSREQRSLGIALVYRFSP